MSFNTPSSTGILVGLVAGVLLLLYGVRLVSDAVQNVASWRVQEALIRLAKFPLAVFGIGVVATALLQSSSAMVSLLVELVSADLIPLSVAIMMLFGANVGTTLVVQLLALHVTDYAFELVALGLVVALLTHRRPAFRRTGRVLFAFGLIILGLAALSAAGKPLADSSVTQNILKALETSPIVLVLTGAALAVALNSSAATIALVLTLAANGAISPVAALSLTLGANIGTTIMPLLASLNKGMLAGRRLALIHSGTKALGAIILIPFIEPLTALLSQLWPDPATLVAMTHLFFNLILAVPLMPFTAPLARLMERLVPDEQSQTTPATSSLRVLDPRALADPSVAQGLATREALHMADIVIQMFEISLQAFQENPAAIQERIEVMDDQVDELDTAIKGYLTQLDEDTMSDGQARQNFALLYIISDLEAIGDVVNRRFMTLARRRLRTGASFSEEGWQDLLNYHQLIRDALQQVIAALAAQNPTLASNFLARKEEFKHIRYELHMRHIRQIRSGIYSTSASGIHQDLLHVINAVLTHTTNIAHILQGEFYEGRGAERLTDGLVPLNTRLLNAKQAVSGPFSKRLTPLQFRAPTTKLLSFNEREFKQRQE